jgi:hypothetical protein
MGTPGERSVEEVEVLSRQANASIVQLPWRKFPGVVVQGDSLSELVELAEEIATGLAGQANEELRGAADELLSTLSGLLAHYEETLTASGVELPYDRIPPPS